MKKNTLFWLLFFILITPSAPANASFYSVEEYTIPIDISVYGDYLFMPHYAFIEEGITYAPARALCEALGANVWWDAKSGSVYVSDDNKEVCFSTIGNTCNIEGNILSAKTHIINGSVFVPIRLLSEAFEFSVGWDSTYFEVSISKEGLYLDDYHIAPYSRDDVIWLSKIVQKEVGYESFPCRLGVANVILNRVKSPSFPDTIYDVIFDTKYGIQFPPAHNGGLDNLTLSEATVIAAKCALNGSNNVGNSLYFIETKSHGSWAELNRPYSCTIGNENFFD